MVFSLLLAVSLALGPSAQESAAPATPGLPEAVEAANDGGDAEALAAFERVVSADPDNHEARLWIARLHARMGDHDLAEPVYRSVLLEDPDNLAAMLGVADALLRRDEPAAAIDVLERPKSSRPTTPTCLARWAGPITLPTIPTRRLPTCSAPWPSHQRDGTC